MTNEQAIKDFEGTNENYRDQLSKYGYVMDKAEKDVVNQIIERNELAISALSADGEYIKKSELFDKTVRRNSIWNEITNAEGKGLEEIVNALPTYSVPDSAENKGEWIVVPDSYHEDGTIYESHWECSKCGSGRSGWGEFKFCPDCGADMRGE